jgi:hypothetical protein
LQRDPQVEGGRLGKGHSLEQLASADVADLLEREEPVQDLDRVDPAAGAREPEVAAGLDDLARLDRSPDLQEVPPKAGHRVVGVGEQPVDDLAAGRLGFQQDVCEQAPRLAPLQPVETSVDGYLRLAEQLDVDAHQATV